MHCSFLSLSWTLSTQVMTARILHSAPHPHRISEIMQHCHWPLPSIEAMECPKKGPCPWQCGYLPPGAGVPVVTGGRTLSPGRGDTRPAPEMGQSVIYCHNLTSQITAPTDNL